jgi:hypothetical protein
LAPLAQLYFYLGDVAYFHHDNEDKDGEDGDEDEDEDAS